VLIDVLANLDIRPRLPRRRDRGLGIVGAGAIVQAAHLPAYRDAGFNVVAIADINRDTAERVAREFGIPRVYESHETLLCDGAVEIVDIAVAPSAQPEIAHAVIATGRSVLCQKPFSTDLEVANGLVEAAEAAGVVVAVNQQMRWEPVIRATRLLLDQGRFGVAAGLHFDIDIYQPWGNWPWLASLPQLEYWYHSIHYLDSVRYLLGEPRSVIASIAKHPSQVAAGETKTFTILEYHDELTVVLTVNHNNWPKQSRALVRFEGTKGRSVGSLGMFADYPIGVPDSMTYITQQGALETSRTFETRWVPDAFVGPMAELQLALEENREPLTSGRDNLNTLALVDAAYRSAAEGRRIHLNPPEGAA
jgi:predicted dehydrogenase